MRKIKALIIFLGGFLISVIISYIRGYRNGKHNQINKHNEGVLKSVKKTKKAVDNLNNDKRVKLRRKYNRK